MNPNPPGLSALLPATRLALPLVLCLSLALALSSCGRQTQTQIIPDVTKPSTVRLSKRAGQGNVHSINVRAAGDIDGTATIKFVIPGGTPPRTVSMSAGQFQVTVLENDWYADTIDLEYEPKGVTRGNIRFFYFFAD